MAKQKPKPVDNSIESYLCRTQGIGIMLAKDIVAKMDSKIRTSVQSLIKDGKPVNEVMAAFKPAPEPITEEQPKTPTE